MFRKVQSIVQINTQEFLNLYMLSRVVIKVQWREWCLFYFMSKSKFLSVCSYHDTYAFQSESRLYSCLNVKELLDRNRCEIWILRDCNWTRTQNHLVRKRTLNHLAKLTKWLSCVLSTYLYGAFDSMFLSFHVPVSEWIHTL